MQNLLYLFIRKNVISKNYSSFIITSVKWSKKGEGFVFFVLIVQSYDSKLLFGAYNNISVRTIIIVQFISEFKYCP